jgi:hypothetical protein
MCMSFKKVIISCYKSVESFFNIMNTPFEVCLLPVYYNLFTSDLI